jgi:hypothetical protein
MEQQGKIKIGSPRDFKGQNYYYILLGIGLKEEYTT